MPFINRLNAKTVATLGASKENEGANLHLHKCKEGGTQWLLHYTLQGRRRKSGLQA
ncbi:hypothetical protein O9A_01407 [Bartonella koehlerae C-29]|uniref:Integrase DNA-binding domain-containing protein n=1 Tax=Bartonella koehlerae C-29 TaxID=1134510 RepID=A0A067WDQ1_9HYPH|nr:DUF4102 domain-containing protein [Bartonella koehlerae]KEC54017.1 hypothetical protein O9A_01407 [Bartonella koehlerae C-29]